MRNTMHWFCLHHGTHCDPKFRLVAQMANTTVAQCLAVWITINEHASANCERGAVDNLNCELVGLALDISPEVVQLILEKMQVVGLLVADRVANWEQLQNVRADPTNAVRQKRHRARSNVTARDVTAQDRTVENSTVKIGQDETGASSTLTKDSANPYLSKNGNPTEAPANSPNDAPFKGRLITTIADLDQTEEALSICQAARPGADPSVLWDKFRRWGRDKPPSGWQRSLKTFATKERLSDDEIRLEQLVISLHLPPRKPGETTGAFAARVRCPPVSEKVADLIRESRFGQSQT